MGIVLALCSACLGTPTPLAPNVSGSVGLPHVGVQTHAVELPPRGNGYRRYRLKGDAYWAQPELVRAVQTVAARVQARFPGAPELMLGDLSARHGGKIARHNSHRSGRDVDLLWAVSTPSGKPVLNPGFLRIASDGLAHDPDSGGVYRLDIERQWYTIKAFLELEEVDVQWMFCSRAVEALLIDYARARGEPDALVWRAQTVMLQPADSLPHDDHIHLRISCSPQNSVNGCIGGGPHWEWFPPLPALPELSPTDLLEIGRSDPLPLQVSEEVLTREALNRDAL
jgi:penicillin-insensitive murein endopeptidase